MLTVAALVCAPIAHAEPSDTGTGSAGSARSSAKRDSANEAKKWQDLEDRTVKTADDLTKGERQILTDRMAQAQDDEIADLQDKIGTLQQLSSAQNTLALEESDAADEVVVLTALETGDTAAARAQVEQDAKDRQVLLDEKRSLANSFADQTQGNTAIAGGVGQMLGSIGAMESLQQYDADQTKAILDARDEAQTDPGRQAELTEEMINLQNDIRAKLAEIQAQEATAIRTILTRV